MDSKDTNFSLNDKAKAKEGPKEEGKDEKLGLRRVLMQKSAYKSSGVTSGVLARRLTPSGLAPSTVAAQAHPSVDKHARSGMAGTVQGSVKSGTMSKESKIRESHFVHEEKQSSIEDAASSVSISQASTPAEAAEDEEPQTQILKS